MCLMNEMNVWYVIQQVYMKFSTKATQSSYSIISNKLSRFGMYNVRRRELTYPALRNLFLYEATRFHFR